MKFNLAINESIILDRLKYIKGLFKMRSQMLEKILLSDVSLYSIFLVLRVFIDILQTRIPSLIVVFVNQQHEVAVFCFKLYFSICPLLPRQYSENIVYSKYN